jgi:hypothetical protein
MFDICFKTDYSRNHKAGAGSLLIRKNNSLQMYRLMPYVNAIVRITTFIETTDKKITQQKTIGSLTPERTN